MSSPGQPREYRPARPLSNRVIALGAVIVLGIGTAAWIVLLRRYAGAGPGVELDAIRTAGTLVVGTGGFAALLLAARRQQSTERTLEHQRETLEHLRETLEHQREILEHQREVAQATERDAAEQRLTELYTRAVDQLGAEKAPVRLGGLHALERLAQNNPDQRQTIVDVICAYLRMPYTPPDDQAPGEDAPEDAHRRYEERRQELQVRLTAQRILAAHLRPEVKAAFWVDIDLNLTEAHLYQLDLSYCHVHTARFDGATFTKTARFDRVKFARGAGFEGAEFAGDAGFERAKFARGAGFEGAEFAGDAGFDGAEFARGVRFDGAKFARDVRFDGAKFAGYAEFPWAKFAGDARFAEAEFAGGDARFDAANFAGRVNFARANFAGRVKFARAKFTKDVWFDGAEFTWRKPEFDGACVSSNSLYVVFPTGWTTRAAQPAKGEKEGWLYVVCEEVSSERPTEASDGGSGQV